MVNMADYEPATLLAFYLSAYNLYTFRARHVYLPLELLGGTGGIKQSLTYEHPRGWLVIYFHFVPCLRNDYSGYHLLPSLYHVTAKEPFLYESVIINHCQNLLDTAAWMVSPRQRIWPPLLPRFWMMTWRSGWMVGLAKDF